jgi:hypothetical protein
MLLTNQGAFNFSMPTIATAEDLYTAGLTKAAEHADLLSDHWNDNAYKILLEFVSKFDIEFMAEDIRQYAEQVRQFTAPASPRAWGGVIVRAKNNKIIESVGVGSVKNKRAHCANATIWKAKGKND